MLDRHLAIELGRKFVQYVVRESEILRFGEHWQNGVGLSILRLNSEFTEAWLSTISVSLRKKTEEKRGMVIQAIRRDSNLLHIGRILGLGTLRVK